MGVVPVEPSPGMRSRGSVACGNVPWGPYKNACVVQVPLRPLQIKQDGLTTHNAPQKCEGMGLGTPLSQRVSPLPARPSPYHIAFTRYRANPNYLRNPNFCVGCFELIICKVFATAPKKGGGIILFYLCFFFFVGFSFAESLMAH